MSLNLSNHIDNSESSNNFFANLLRQTFWFTPEIVNQIFEIQNKQKIRGINASIGDILFKNKTINQRFASKEQFLTFLNSKWFPLRLWEQLLVSHKLSSWELDNSLDIFYDTRRIDNKVLFWDILLSNDVISSSELIEFLENSRVRLRVWEILLSKGLIDQHELPELLEMQQTMRKKWNNQMLIDLLNSKKRWKVWIFKSSKPDYIDSFVLKDILWLQKLSVMRVMANDRWTSKFNTWIEVWEDTMDDDKFTRIFWASKQITPEIVEQNDDSDPWAYEALHPSIRKMTK